MSQCLIPPTLPSRSKKQSTLQKKKITRIVREITQEGIDNLEENIVGILVGLNSDHFKEGRTNANLAVIIPVE